MSSNVSAAATTAFSQDTFAIPQEFWRCVGRHTLPDELPKGLDAWWNAAAGWLKRRACSTNRFLARADAVLALEQGYAVRTDAELKEAAVNLAVHYRLNRDTVAHARDAGAVIREVAFRIFGFRHHREQLAGSLALAEGCIAEMATGEGKTLTAGIPAILAAWRGKGCHVLTVNDYLAGRDCEEMGKLYGFFGLKAVALNQESTPEERRAAYAADITYLTNKEAAADFLRDRLALGPVSGLPAAMLGAMAGAGVNTGNMVQRGLEFAIVDEADSVLVDEAVTPLLISGETPNSEESDVFMTADKLAVELIENTHYRIDPKHKEVNLTKTGEELLAKEAESLSGFWCGKRRREEMVTQALNGRFFFRRDKEYTVYEGKVVIVDEATGRLMPDRTWRGGLHQAVEVKEGLEPTPPKATFARLSFQRFFRLYKKLSGMTGTGKEATGEFWQIYRAPVTRIPTHRRCLRIQHQPRVFFTDEAKWKEVVEEVKRVHSDGRPVLVGTRSIEDSEKLSAMLKTEGVQHQILNAVLHAQEAEIVKLAGQKSAVTVATNMAGRGTDIKLSPETAALGGLHVVSAERNLTPRIDRQLYGRSSRQGDPGSALAIVSMDDELAKRFCPWLRAAVSRAFMGGMVSRLPGWLIVLFDYGAWKAERQALSQRKQVLQADNWLRDTLGFAGKDL